MTAVAMPPARKGSGAGLSDSVPRCSCRPRVYVDATSPEVGASVLVKCKHGGAWVWTGEQWWTVSERQGVE